MVLLGLLLLLGAGVLTVAVVVDNTDAVSVSAFGQAASGLTVGRLFLAGVIAGAVAVLGLTMLLAGLSRRRTRRVGRKQEMRDVRDERETLADENARLRDELAAARSGRDGDSAVYPSDPTEDQTAGRHADTGRRGLFHR